MKHCRDCICYVCLYRDDCPENLCDERDCYKRHCDSYIGGLTMTSEMPVKNLLEIIMLFRENTGLKLETTLYDDFAVLSNNKFKIIVMGREKRADNE